MGEGKEGIIGEGRGTSIRIGMRSGGEVEAEVEAGVGGEDEVGDLDCQMSSVILVINGPFFFFL